MNNTVLQSVHQYIIPHVKITRTSEHVVKLHSLHKYIIHQVNITKASEQVVKKTNAASLYNAMFSNDGENRNLEVSRLTGLPEDHPSIGIIERFYGFGKVGHQGGLQHVLRLIKRDLNDFNVDFKKYDDLMSNDAIFSAVYDDKPFNLFPPISHPQ